LLPLLPLPLLLLGSPRQLDFPLLLLLQLLQSRCWVATLLNWLRC
jgi:hypothetical protein